MSVILIRRLIIGSPNHVIMSNCSIILIKVQNKLTFSVDIKKRKIAVTFSCFLLIFLYCRDVLLCLFVLLWRKRFIFSTSSERIGEF